MDVLYLGYLIKGIYQIDLISVMELLIMSLGAKIAGIVDRFFEPTNRHSKTTLIWSDLIRADRTHVYVDVNTLLIIPNKMYFNQVASKKNEDHTCTTNNSI